MLSSPVLRDDISCLAVTRVCLYHQRLDNKSIWLYYVLVYKIFDNCDKVLVFLIRSLAKDA
jgi:hypothetical protein